MNTVYIYGLTDPETDEVRYIGKSIRPLERLQNHMNEKSNCHRSHWLQSLKKRDMVPGLIIFEEIQGAWPWQESERYWIKRGKRLGWRLTNNTSGGDGVSDLPPEARAKMAATWKGRKHSPEAVEKIRAAKTGVICSDETRARMSASQRGRKMTWGAKLADATMKLSVTDVKDILDAIANGARTGNLAKQYKVHRTTISKVKMGTYVGHSRTK